MELTGVELTDRGYAKVNDRLETTAPGVWAVGKVAGSSQYTHISEDDFRVLLAVSFYPLKQDVARVGHPIKQCDLTMRVRQTV